MTLNGCGGDGSGGGEGGGGGGGGDMVSDFDMFVPHSSCRNYHHTCDSDPCGSPPLFSDHTHLFEFSLVFFFIIYFFFLFSPPLSTSIPLFS